MSSLQINGSPGFGGPGFRPDFNKLFAKIDTDGDGKVSKDEFVKGAPKELDATKAGELYDQLAKATQQDATSGTGSDSSSVGLSASDLQTGFQSLSGRTKSALLDLQNVSATDSANSTATLSSEDLLKQVSDILSQLVSAIELAKKNDQPTTATASASSTTSVAVSSQSASTDSTSGTASASTATSTSDATLTASIGAELEKLLSARHAYGVAYGNGFQLFQGSAGRAAA
jgi:hypothetical protein